MYLNTCIYFKPKENQNFDEIKEAIDLIELTYRNEYRIKKIIVETDEYSQLNIFLNREIDRFDCLILNTEIDDEFYKIVFEALVSQKQLKIVLA